MISTQPETFYQAATGFSANGLDIDLINNGTIRVIANGIVNGVFSSVGSGWIFNNSGNLIVTSYGAEAKGVITVGSFSNNGTIVVTGQKQVFAVDIVRFEGANFYNSGTIRAIDTSLTHGSIGVLWKTGSDGGNLFVNDGRIEGDFAVRVISGFIPSGPPELFTNNGTLVGNVEMGDGPSRLLNRGLIQGLVNFGRGTDLYDGTLGNLSGALDGGEGSDTLLGGVGVETLVD